MKMGNITIGHINDQASLESVYAEFEAMNPGFKMGAGTYDSEDGVLASEYRGVRHIWIHEGTGEIYLTAGYRTKEGDGEKLPEVYITDEVDADILEVLQLLAANLDSIHEKIIQPANAIIERLSGLPAPRTPACAGTADRSRQAGKTLAGDIAGDIWLMVESGLDSSEWSTRSDVREALLFLSEEYSRVGWSTKEVDSFEPIQPGDQITVTGDEEIKIKGKFRYWWIENLEGILTHISTARRLRYLKDTAGGCNFAFDAFRRLPLTWYINTGTEDNPDGINTVNSHIVNIAAETSKAHYHPAILIGGGKPQSEIYFVLDPAVYSLNTYGRESYLWAFPNVDNLSISEKVPLSPGSVVYIPPGTGHQGIDAFVNVITLPGFKPGNEIYFE
jgi:hypothetical protein